MIFGFKFWNPFARLRYQRSQEKAVLVIADFLAENIAVNRDPEWRQVLPTTEPPASWFYERFLCCEPIDDVHQFHQLVHEIDLDPVEVTRQAIFYILEGQMYTSKNFIDKANEYYHASQSRPLHFQMGSAT